MGWVDDLHGKTVGVDTSPFIYLIEGNPTYLKAVAEFFPAVDAGHITAVISTVTLLQWLVQPFRRGADGVFSFSPAPRRRPGQRGLIERFQIGNDVGLLAFLLQLKCHR